MKSRNTIIQPWVDVTEDVRGINAGRGNRIGNAVAVNGRTYGIESTARLYPISGPGFVLLDRGADRALGYYNEYGISDLAERNMDQAHITLRSREIARQVLESGDSNT